MTLESVANYLASIDRELWIVTASNGQTDSGLVATTVMPVSIVPSMPRMLVTIGRRHHTWNQIEASDCLALHLLGVNQLEWAWRFGLQSSRDIDKFNGIPTSCGQSGSPILPGVAAWLDCRVENRMESGDRTIYLAEVIDGDYDPAVEPLTLQQMVARAHADKLTLLKSQRDDDIDWDENAISAWRAK